MPHSLTVVGLLTALVHHSLVRQTAVGYPLPSSHGPNVLDVREQFGAKGDGLADDTEAIRAAIVFARSQGNTTVYPWNHGAPAYVPRVLYLPAGRYLVSDTLQLYPDPVLTREGHVPDAYFLVSLELLVMGDGVDETTVVLRDHATGFGNRAQPRAVWLTFPGSHHNDGQWLGYSDLTVDCGKGNPGAVGLDHISNNVGGVHDVRIIGNGGAVGLDFSRQLGGLTYFRRISVEGFRVGMNFSSGVIGAALEHCSVRQAEIGLQLTDKLLSVRNLTTDETVLQPVLVRGKDASLILIDSTLDATLLEADGRAPTAAVVSPDGAQLFLRNVTVGSGLGAVVNDTGNIVKRLVDEYSHSAPFSLFEGSPRTSSFHGVAIADTPSITHDLPHTWRVLNVDQLDKATATVALQSAIDHPTTRTLYLTRSSTSPPPQKGGSIIGPGEGGVQITQIVLRKQLRRLHGGWTGLGSLHGQDTPAGYMNVRVDTAEHLETILIESIDVTGILHQSANVLIIRHVFAHHPRATCFATLRSEGTTTLGVVFVESFQPKNTGSDTRPVGGPSFLLSSDAQVWARALDIEGTLKHVENRGGNLWVLGSKLGERQGNPTVLATAGRTEFLGGLLNGGTVPNTTIVFADDADASVIGFAFRFEDQGDSISEEVTGKGQRAISHSAFPSRQSWECLGHIGCSGTVGHNACCRWEVGSWIPFYRTHAVVSEQTMVDQPHGSGSESSRSGMHSAPAGSAWCTLKRRNAAAAAGCTGVNATASCPAGLEDCLSALQQAVDRCCPYVLVQRRANNQPWTLSSSLKLRSHAHIEFQPQVTLLAQRGRFQSKGAPLVYAFNVTNLTLTGYGARWQMHKLDYANVSMGYVHSEARPGLWVYNASDLRVFGLTVSSCGGDGIEVVNSRRVHIADVVLDDNYRQGMSVVGIADMLVENSVFSNTGQGAGTSPMAGVDIEPDDFTQGTVNLTFRNCVSRNNIGGGYDIGLKRNNATTYLPPKRPLSILFDNCSVEGSGDYVPQGSGYISAIDGSFGGYNIGGVEPGLHGSITVRNAVIYGTPRPGLFMYDVAPSSAQVLIEHTALRRTATNLTVRAPYSGSPNHVIASAPIVVLHECRLGLPYCYVVAECCAVSFRNVTVTDDQDRPFMWVDSAGGPSVGVRNEIVGDVEVANPFGCNVSGNGSATLDVHVACRP